jgi:N-glycosylase/DNA lyase
MCKRTPRLKWVARRRAGRILRCGSVFEDLMKLLFTTNCSWAATKLMTSRLTDALGAKAPSGARAFPTPAKCAAQDEAFYRKVVSVGYRAKCCIAIAKAFATGQIDDAWFTDRSLGIGEVRERLLALPGIGPYAAGQAMRTLGHYKDLALDSWCRARLATLAGKKKPPTDRAVTRRYAAFDPYDGLALWMDLTAEWHGHG